MPRRGRPKRSDAAVVMHLEHYVCCISEQENRLGGSRFGELKELEELYRDIAKNLRQIAKEMCEIAAD